MKRIVNGLRTKRDSERKSNYTNAGFKSYENTFSEVKRPCNCVSAAKIKKS